MSEYTLLIQAIASLLWPIFAFTALLLFKSRINDVLSRLKKGKLLGQELELSESLARLDQSANAVEKEIAALPDPPNVAQLAQQADNDIVKEILSEASRSPKLALMKLATELEKSARHLLACTGHLRGRSFVPLSQAIDELDKAYGLPRHVPSSLKFFWEARNQIVHGLEAKDEEVLSALDSGITILKAIHSMPRPNYVVIHSGVPIYSDNKCENQITNAKGVILESQTAGGLKRDRVIFPTTKSHLEKGRLVSWEWDLTITWGPSWYRDPENDKIIEAWHSSGNFIGRHLDNV